MGSKTIRILIVVAIGGGAVYALFMGGVVYAIAFMMALLMWFVREAVWWRGSGSRGGFIREFFGGGDNGCKNQRDKGEGSKKHPNVAP
jgi:hypothetical protein